MRSMWSGDISWGLIVIPAKIYKATSDFQSPFHQVHDADGGRITYRRFCTTCGKEVAWENIASGVTVGDDTYKITDDELNALPVPTAKTIEVVHFADAAQIDPLLMDGHYYTAPAANAAGKAYALLRDTLNATGLVAVCKITLRKREHLALLMPRGELISLVTLRWPAEVRSLDAELPGNEATAAERAMARKLVLAGKQKFSPGEYADEYAEAVNRLVDAKAANRKPPAGKKAKAAKATPDLGAALQASLDAMQEKKPARKAPARKRAASKAA